MKDKPNFQGLYVIRDKVADEPGPIFQAKNDAVALRNFRDLIAKSTCKDDYELLFVAYYDPDTFLIFSGDGVRIVDDGFDKVVPLEGSHA